MPRIENAQDRKRTQLRERLWPGSARWIWDFQDKENVKGFATMTRLTHIIHRDEEWLASACV
jgi:hypothetical protein